MEKPVEKPEKNTILTDRKACELLNRYVGHYIRDCKGSLVCKRICSKFDG